MKNKQKDIINPIILPFKKLLYLILLSIKILLTCICIDKLPNTENKSIKQALITLLEIIEVENIPLVKSNMPHITIYK